MTRVVIHSAAAAVREEIVPALLAHFGRDPEGFEYRDMKVTAHLPGVLEADAIAACDLYVLPHGFLHFVHDESGGR